MRITPEALLARIFLSILSFVVAFLGVDYLSTWIVATRSPIEREFPIHHTRRPEPYVMFSGTPWVEGLNGSGYRGPRARLPKDSAEFRIFVLGGSTVFNGEPPIATLMDSELARRGWPRARVYNFGVLSSVSGMELTRLVHEVVGLEPDLVVMYNGANDYNHPRNWDPRPGYPFNFVAYENNPLLESDVRSYPALLMFAYGSNLFRAIAPSAFAEGFTSLSGLRDSVGWGAEEWRDSIAAVYIRNLVKARVVSEAFGARFAAFFQPVLYFKDHLTPEEAAFANEDEREFTVDMRARIRARMAAAREATGAHLIDLSDTFETTRTWVFSDRVHTRQSAKRPIANRIVDEILTLGLLARDAPTPGERPFVAGRQEADS